MYPLKGKKILITAGPTHEPIDPVRFIGNRSTGKMGFALAKGLAEKGAEVFLVSGPVHIELGHTKIHRFDVQTANEMFEKTVGLFPGMHGAILSAAVADFAPAKPSENKIKKQGGQGRMTIELVKTRDILGHLGQIKGEKQFLVGFSLETDNELENARAKLKRKNLDFIVLNSLRDKGAGFEKDTNKVTILDKSGQINEFPLKPKAEVARDIIRHLQEVVSF